jgi:hypothetical protein
LIGIPLLSLLAWVVISYAIWMLKPTSMSFGARSVEWVRVEVPLGNTLVDDIEHIYYTANAPQKGGPAPKRLPAVGLSRPGSKQTAVWPPPITPVFAHPLHGEGLWKPTGPLLNGGPPVLVTSFRPEAEYPELLAYVAWFDHTRTAIGYYPGRYEPPNAAVRGPMMVPYGQRWRLLATFNGGFTYEDGENGSTIDGQVNEPLKDGKATLVGYRDGRVEIVQWSGGPNAGPNVAWTRQSLAPIVWDGRLNPALNENPNSGMGVHARRRHARVAHRRRRRSPRQPALRRSRRPDGDLDRQAPPTHRRGARDGVRHQPLLAHADHLHPRPRAPPKDGRAPAQPLGRSLPRPRRP